MLNNPEFWSKLEILIIRIFLVVHLVRELF